jgi:ankyrin repeat protein
MDDILSCFERVKKFDIEHSEKIRKKQLSSQLNTNQKMELYNCAVNGNVDTLKNLIEVKKYPLMEECSAAGYFWTVIHYAAHYGFVNIVAYVLEYYQNHPEKLDILNLQSNLGLSPLFISLNNSTDIEKKKQILELYVKYDAIDFKICTKEGDDIFDLCKKHNLLEFFLSILKED